MLHDVVRPILIKRECYPHTFALPQDGRVLRCLSNLCRSGMVLLLFVVSWIALTPYRATYALEGAPSPLLLLAVDRSKDASCLECHRDPALRTNLLNGESLSLYVDERAYRASVHWSEDVGCVDCHPNIRGYPHPPLLAYDRRDFTIGLYTRCKSCHEKEYRRNLDSMHARELAAGNRNAPVCSDCHGYHDVRSIKERPLEIVRVCSRCHSTIYKQYEESVHGSALIGEGNPDVPTCIDCHGVHSIANPLTYWFHNNSPLICADCHTDEKRMAKYGISTDVWNTYVADFHGTTVELFVKYSPDQPTNKPVCTDCHGVHDIKEVTDPEARVVKENLLRVCRECHPDATPNFPSAWVGHYRASPERHPLVYYVELFYRILIPLVLGFFGGVIVLETLHDVLLVHLCRRRKEG